MTDAKTNLKSMKEGWDYSDVIALVTAYLPGTRFNGDRSLWMKGMSEVVDRYPKLLDGVRFKRRGEFTPYSPQVDEVLKMLGRWEYRGDFNPRFRRIEIDEEGKETLKANLEPKLQEHASDIRSMAKILAKYVALNPATVIDDEPRTTQE